MSDFVHVDRLLNSKEIEISNRAGASGTLPGRELGQFLFRKRTSDVELFASGKMLPVLK